MVVCGCVSSETATVRNELQTVTAAHQQTQTALSNAQRTIATLRSEADGYKQTSAARINSLSTKLAHAKKEWTAALGVNASLRALNSQVTAVVHQVSVLGRELGTVKSAVDGLQRATSGRTNESTLS